METEFFVAAQRTQLVQAAYAPARELIKEQAGDSTVQYVTGLGPA